MEESFLKYRDTSAEDSDDLFDCDFQNSLKSSTRQLISENFNFTVDETTSGDDDRQIQSEVSQNENSSNNLSHKESSDTEDSEKDSFRKHVKMRRRKPLLFDDTDEDENKSSDLSQNSKSKMNVYKNKLEKSDSAGSLGTIESEEDNQNEKKDSEQTENQVTATLDKDQEASSIEILTNQLSTTIILSSDDEANIKSKQDLNITPPNNASTPNKILVKPKINSKLLRKEYPSLGYSAKQIICTDVEKEKQKQKTVTIQVSLRQVENILRTFNLDGLPDRGEKLKERMKMLTEELQQEEEKLNNMVVDTAQMSKQITTGPNMPSWKNLQVLSNQVLPAGFGGKKAMETLQAQKSLTMEKLKILHQSLQTRPKEEEIVDDPKGIKVELMHHQRQALAFLLWRETQKPSGGILADDMGLGKTLTMIALILKSQELNLENNQEYSGDSDEENKDENELKNKRNREYYPGGTLVICPATLVEQWANEIKKHCRRDILNVELYHGPNREMKSRRLAKHDVVITTYNLVGRERDCTDRLFGVRWKRIILDEAHVVRNYKSQSSIGVCALKAQHRWCLTGTPIHNKEIDLFALLKFLRCSPFDSLPIWKKWIDNKSAGGQERINTIIQSIMLRRTKVNLQELGTFSLPSKQMDVINVKLNKEETKIYQKILIFSKTLFAQFLHQRAEKNVDLMYSNQNNVQFLNSNPNSEYEKIHKQLLQMNGGQTVKAHQILVLLLRLRQICCHPSLIRTMLENEACAADGIDDADGNDIDLLEQIKNLNINDETNTNEITEEESVDKLGAAASKIIDYKGEIFNPKSLSSKIKIVINTLQEKVINNGDKAIIVSQWTSMLEIVERHLKVQNINCVTLNGSVPVPKRIELVDLFNKSSSPVQVMLLSLTAGGVGLNLVGANHLLLIDLHWNPQLEAQAQDRIYRVGQKKPVIIYKFVTLDTIEERIKALQDNKLSMATNILTGSKPAGSNKLSMDDLKMLFNMT